jgi:hypothetical protein
MGCRTKLKAEIEPRFVLNDINNPMKKYTLSLMGEFDEREEIAIYASSLDDAESKAREILEAWVREKEDEYDILGLIVRAGCVIYPEEDEFAEERSFDIRVEPDHELLIWVEVQVRPNPWLCGYRPGDHDWICDSSTSAECCDHCRQCGLRRTRTAYGFERKPDQHDTVIYYNPKLASLEPEEKDLDRISDRLHNSKNLPPGLLYCD